RPRMKPTGFFPAAASAGPEVAIFQLSHRRKAATIQLAALSTPGWLNTTRPRPKATTNIIAPMPRPTPSRHGSPRRTPTPAPVAVRRRLLGPGVPAAATAKSRNATTCSGVMMDPMADRPPTPGGSRLERSCGVRPSDWLRRRELSDGVQALQAWFAGRGFDTHRHDTYAIGLTDVGVQAFDYRGVAEASTPGQVVVLHPDETHDGRAGTPDGFGYRIGYVPPPRRPRAPRGPPFPSSPRGGSRCRPTGPSPPPSRPRSASSPSRWPSTASSSASPKRSSTPTPHAARSPRLLLSTSARCPALEPSSTQRPAA